MKKVDLTMNEYFEYETVKSFVDHEGSNFKHMCAKLGCCERTGWRKVKGYKEHGKSFFIHGNRNKTSPKAIDKAVKDRVIELYNSYEFSGANISHFYELLNRFYPDEFTFSLSSLRNILREYDIISPLAIKKTKREWNKRQKEKKNVKDKVKDVNNTVIVSSNESYSDCFDHDPHPTRVKSKYAGELIFLDASNHDWFSNGNPCFLHAAIDDATGIVVGAFFDVQETLFGYYNVLNQMLSNYGIAVNLQTDGRSIFEYAAFKNKGIENDRLTQFSYACKYFGMKLNTVSVAQKQGKIERLWKTLQSRLVTEFRVLKIEDIKRANEFLDEYLTKFNRKFAHSYLDDTPSAFEVKPSEEEINLHLARIFERTVTNGNDIRFNNKRYRIVDENSNPLYPRPKTKVEVIEAFDKNLFVNVNNSIYALEEIHLNEEFSSELDFVSKKKEAKKRYIPDMNHAWVKGNIYKHQRKQKTYKFVDEYGKEYSYEDILYSEKQLFNQIN